MSDTPSSSAGASAPETPAGKPAILVDADVSSSQMIDLAVQKACGRGSAADLRAWCIAPPSPAMWRAFARHAFQSVAANDESDALARMERHCRILARLKNRPSEVWLCMEPGRAARLLPRLQDTGLRFVLLPTKSSPAAAAALAGLARVLEPAPTTRKSAALVEQRAQEVEKYLARAIPVDAAPGVAVAMLAGNLLAPLAERLMAHAGAMGPILCADAFLWTSPIGHWSLLVARKRAIGLHWRDTRADAETAYVQHVARLSQSLPAGSRVILCASASDKIDGLADVLRDAGLLPHLIRIKGSASKDRSSAWASVTSINNLPQAGISGPSAYDLVALMPGGVPLSLFAKMVGVDHPDWPDGVEARRAAREDWLAALREQFPDLWIGRALVAQPGRLANSVPVTRDDAAATTGGDEPVAPTTDSDPAPLVGVVVDDTAAQ